MEEVINTQKAPEAAKTWSYTEKTRKHTVHHTISVTKDRFTHESQVDELSQKMRQRSDVRLDNVNAVHTYFGYKRNILAIILCVLFAIASFIFMIHHFVSEQTGFGFVFLILLVAFSLIIYFLFKKRPSFVLEFETVIPYGTLCAKKLAHGNPTIIDLGNKKRNPILALITWPLHFFARSGVYKLEMPIEVGNEIVDTIGAFLIEK